MKWTKKEQKQLIIFSLTAFGLPVLMGCLMGYSFYQGNDVSVFANAHMFYPASGVMLALISTREKGQKLPLKFYFGFLISGIVMIGSCLASIFIPEYPWALLCQYPIIISSIICLILLFLEKKEVRAAYGLKFTGRKKAKSWWYVLLFFILYLSRLVIACAIGGQMEGLAAIVTDPLTYTTLFTLLVLFFLTYTGFFGEEYGWRYFFQPLLQKRFGPKGGVILLGILWGLWHLPLNIFFYSPDTWVASVILQVINCIGFAIFFGYGYMKTGNIWVAVMMHYINNNMIAVISGVEAVSNQVIRWADIPLSILLNLVFMVFIFSKVYKKESPAASDSVSN